MFAGANEDHAIVVQACMTKNIELNEGEFFPLMTVFVEQAYSQPAWCV